jgi:hypothetical protein
MKCTKQNCNGTVEEADFSREIGICDTCGQRYETKSYEEIEFEEAQEVIQYD